MEFANQLNNNSENFAKSTFNNFNYINDKVCKKRLILDTLFANSNISSSAEYDTNEENANVNNENIKAKYWDSDVIEFNIPLFRELNIEKTSDVFIEQITFWDLIPFDRDNEGNIKNQNIYFKIDEFSNEIYSNNLNIDYYTIPNEVNTNSKNDSPYTFKSKKMNYLATVTSRNINNLKLTLKSENLQNDSGVKKYNTSGVFKKNGRCIIELIIIEK